jgi:hypothetical protein
LYSSKLREQIKEADHKAAGARRFAASLLASRCENRGCAAGGT